MTPILVYPAEAARIAGLSVATFYRALRTDPRLMRCRRHVPGRKCPKYSSAAVAKWAEGLGHSQLTSAADIR